MTELPSDRIIDEVKKDFVVELIKRGNRIDGRGFMERRESKVIPGVISSADGSAFARLGHTQVVAGVKVQAVQPFPDTPDKGVLSVSAELLPLASYIFEPGPPDENAVELARVVDRGIRSSEMIDLSSLFIEEGVVYGIFLDLYILDYDGNLFDASYLAAIEALKNTRLPAYEDGQLVKEKANPLEVRRSLSSNTFVKIAGRLLLDPCLAEEKAADARFTVVKTSDGYLCALQKAGPGGFTREEILQMVEF